jgi:hypothetical protein
MVVTGDMRGFVENNGVLWGRPAENMGDFGKQLGFEGIPRGIHCSYAASNHPRQLSLQFLYSGKTVPKQCLQCSKQCVILCAS